MGRPQGVRDEMDTLRTMPTNIPGQERMYPGHLACPGCGAAIAMRLVLKGLKEKVVVVIPACCWTIIAGPYPYTSLQAPVLHVPFGTGAAVASGIRAALDVRGDEGTQVVTWAGDGGTFDLGLQALSGAAERNENILYVCYDNEAYMNTGGQASSATPYGARTTVTPKNNPKRVWEKDIVRILAAHRIPYAATASIAYPDDLVRKVQKAASTTGTRFLHIFAPCPPGWKVPSKDCIRMARLAVRTRVFPLYEVEEGERYTISAPLDDCRVDEYCRAQGRFEDMTREELESIQAEVNKNWEWLKARAGENR